MERRTREGGGAEGGGKGLQRAAPSSKVWNMDSRTGHETALADVICSCTECSDIHVKQAWVSRTRAWLSMTGTFVPGLPRRQNFRDTDRELACRPI